MSPYTSTVVGSYPRPTRVEDTLKKPTLSPQEVDDLIRWAARDQAELGLDIVTDGEGYRENMYYFYQKRLDGVSMEKEVIAAGCDYIQFDEPMWTESPEQSGWEADILTELIESLRDVRVGLHVCGGNPLENTRAKLRVLTHTCEMLRQ